MDSKSDFLNLINDLEKNKKFKSKDKLSNKIDKIDETDENDENDENDEIDEIDEVDEISKEQFMEFLDKLNDIKKRYQNGEFLITKDSEIYKQIQSNYYKIIKFNKISSGISVNVHCIWLWWWNIYSRLNENIDITLEIVPIKIFIPEIGLINTIPRFMILFSEKEQIEITKYIHFHYLIIKKRKHLKLIMKTWKISERQVIFLSNWLFNILKKPC